MDDLKTGDLITIYYSTALLSSEDGLNRHAQFVVKDGALFFAANGFQKNLGYVLIGLAFAIMLMGGIF